MGSRRAQSSLRTKMGTSELIKAETVLLNVADQIRAYKAGKIVEEYFEIL